MKAEQEKKVRSEQELEEIIQAAKETRRLQEEQIQASEAIKVKQVQERRVMQSSESDAAVGQKRNSPSEKEKAPQNVGRHSQHGKYQGGRK